MNYFLKNQIDKVRTFKVRDGHLLTIQNDILYMDGIVMDQQVDPKMYEYIENQLIYIKGDKTIIGNQSIDQSILIDSINMEKKSAIFSKNFDVENLTMEYNIVNLIDLTKINELGVKPFITNVIYSGGNMILTINKTIISYPCHSNTIFWQADLSSLCEYVDIFNKHQLGNIEEIIGIHQGIIWVSITNNTLLGLNEHTGEIQFKIRELHGIDRLIDYKNAILDIRNNKILILFTNSYCKISCTTGVVDFFDLTDEYKQHDIFSCAIPRIFDGENIYFIDSANPRGEKVVMYNISSKKIIWKHIFENDPQLILQEVQYSDNRLYVRDNYKRLHVFHKE